MRAKKEMENDGGIESKREERVEEMKKNSRVNLVTSWNVVSSTSWERWRFFSSGLLLSLSFSLTCLSSLHPSLPSSSFSLLHSSRTWLVPKPVRSRSVRRNFRILPFLPHSPWRKKRPETRIDAIHDRHHCYVSDCGLSFPPSILRSLPFFQRIPVSPSLSHPLPHFQIQILLLSRNQILYSNPCFHFVGHYTHKRWTRRAMLQSWRRGWTQSIEALMPWDAVGDERSWKRKIFSICRPVHILTHSFFT